MSTNNSSGRTETLSTAQLAMLINNAAGFFEAARRASQFVPSGVPGQFVAPLPAAIVCLAFCTELLLKALIEVGGSPAPEWHQLPQLFEKLDDVTKKRIERKLGLSTNETKEMMNDIGSPFVEWRYWHETTGKNIQINFDKLKKLAIALSSDLTERTNIPGITATFAW